MLPLRWFTPSAKQSVNGEKILQMILASSLPECILYLLCRSHQQAQQQSGLLKAVCQSFGHIVVYYILKKYPVQFNILVRYFVTFQ